MHVASSLGISLPGAQCVERGSLEESDRFDKMAKNAKKVVRVLFQSPRAPFWLAMSGIAVNMTMSGEGFSGSDAPWQGRTAAPSIGCVLMPRPP